MNTPILRTKRDTLVSMHLQELHEALATHGIREPVRAEVESVARLIVTREAQQRALLEAARAEPFSPERSPRVQRLLAVLESIDGTLLQIVPSLVRALRGGDLPSLRRREP
ncbi:hypothetical protein FGE12_23260 [Aggregicoccus sp. 17bor-14]|uniref:hypothetical protein n=1 Tax=Myxococcaceae TaxID=31 RepID=UPI00129C3904|nr:MULTISPECIES: hypothetical protein [Myxococcaceae]MBF5045343.1 hypothetical protein [Simulacricoccus sp. 17bor-14]MRI91085.1 hypothetical protein [Aggregicoccus sp. 17bor-14]